jgi:hypothetical protein
MKPSRRTQPYRADTGRPAGPALHAMLRGRSAVAANPQDASRMLQNKRRLRLLRLLVRNSMHTRGRNVS